MEAVTPGEEGRTSSQRRGQEQAGEGISTEEGSGAPAMLGDRDRAGDTWTTDSRGNEEADLNGGRGGSSHGGSEPACTLKHVSVICRGSA
jgi:hypothetical protein